MASEEKGMKLQVHLRLLPQSGENKDGIVTTEPPRIMYLTDPVKGHKSEFVFDKVFGTNSPQIDVFEEVGRPLVEHVLQGFNACCFAYGQTGSGKSYSMFGQEGGEYEQRGIIPRCAEQLFQSVTDLKRGQGGKLSVFVSFLEIYLEQVRDLGYLAAGSRPASPDSKDPKRSAAAPDRSNLELYEDPSTGMTLVKDLTYIEVSSSEQVLAVMRAGTEARQTAATGQNEMSSRSHTLFTISVVQYRDGGLQPITGRLHLVDLAGSERLSKSNSEGARLTETKFINTSLTALGKVVMLLAQQSDGPTSPGAAMSSITPRQHIPFRDSKLTRLLKDSLQGNCYTSLLATLNPHPDNYDECFATLQFALRCQSISTAPHVNTIGPGGTQDAVLEHLMQQVTQLRQELEYTHTHYQRLLETVAGANWAAESAAAEESEAPAADAAAGTAQDSSGAGGRGGSHSASHIATLEAKLRRLEAQIAACNTKLSGTDSRLSSKRTEAEDFRERMMAKDFSQVNEMKRLREQVNHAKSALAEAQAHVKQREDEAQRRYDDGCSRLSADNEALRSQLAAISQSVNNMMDTRSSRAMAAKQQRDALIYEADRRLREQVAMTVAEKDRQLKNLRQQSDYHLQRKSEEIMALRDELAKLKACSQEEIAGIMADTDHVASYAAKVTEVLRRLETGVYAVVERGGLRHFKLPQRDKPAALQEDKLQHLQQAVDGVDRLLAASAAAAAAPTTSLSTSSATLPPASRTQSAAVSGGGAARPRRSSGADLHADTEGGDTSAQPLSASDVQALQAQWEASYREKITQEVAAELLSDKTMEYISSLESQVARFRQDVQTQKKQTNDMLVTLRSVQREQSRPGSAINTALAGQVLSRPPTWGPGHLNGLAAAEPVGRPNTASATMKAPPGSAGWVNQHLPRSGSWGMGSGSGVQLSSSGGGYIRENGY